MSDTTETETETNTDNTDEPSKAELHDRVQKLESTVEKLMPSRRDALRLGAAGIAGAAGLSATTQPADASTGSAGQIGDSSNRPDIFADTVDANEVTRSGGWSSVRSSRSLNTQFTNTNGSDIQVSVVLNINNSGTIGARLNVGSVNGVGRFELFRDAGDVVTLQGAVPDGATYEVDIFINNSNVSLRKWLER